MTFLLANWRTLAAIGLFAIYSAFIFRLGSLGPEAKLAEMKAAGAAQNAHTAAVEVLTKEISHAADKAAKGRFGAIDRYYADRMRNASAGKMPGTAAATGSTEPTATASVPDPARCTDRDSAHDAEQVILLQSFYRDVQAAVGG